LVVRDNRIGTGSIDDVEVFEKVDVPMEGSDLIRNLNVVVRFPIFELVNPVGGRQDIHLAKIATKKSVEQGRFTSFDLAHHHEQEWLAKVRHQVLQVAQRVVRRPDLMSE